MEKVRIDQRKRSELTNGTGPNGPREKVRIDQ